MTMPKADQRLSAAILCLFEDLKAARIYGGEVVMMDWSVAEGWDSLAQRVSPEVALDWGWESPADYSLCWIDIWRARDSEHDFEGERDWHEEHTSFLNRVSDPETIFCYFDGRDDTDRRRIGEALVALAPRHGMKTRWNGDPERAVALSLVEGASE